MKTKPVGIVVFTVLKTVDVLNLTDDLLDYGSFASALIETYRRLREPLFEPIISLFGSLGVSISLLHLDFALIYLLLSANTFLALPYVLDRMSDAEKRILEPMLDLARSPFTIARNVAAPLLDLIEISILSEDWRREFHEKWLDVWNKGKLLATQRRIVAFVGYWLSGIIFIVVVVVLGAAANVLITVPILGLYLAFVTVILVIIPIAPFTNTLIFLAQWLGLMFRVGPRSSISRARLQFKAGVLPWYYPLLAVAVCFFAIYSADSLIERLR